MKPLEMCLPLPLVQKVAMSFYGEIEIIGINFLRCLLDLYSYINCIYRLFIQHFESGNEAIGYKLEKSYLFKTIKVSINKINLINIL